MAPWHCALLLGLLVALSGVSCKTFDRCELARELKNHGIPTNLIATWVCVADRESNMRTWPTNYNADDASTDHGIFQINDRYWCGPGKACDMSCDSLKDDDISNDIRCAQHIFDEWQGRGEVGFMAWAAYNRLARCRRPGEVNPYVQGCGIW